MAFLLDPATNLPIGVSVDPAPAKRPGRVEMEGRYARLVPLDAGRHGDSLWAGTAGRDRESLWLYLADGPFAERHLFDIYLEKKAASDDPLFYAVIDIPSNSAVGHVSYLRIEPPHRSIEVGSILYTPALQRTAAATEAMYLMARYAFEELGYRRYEWKCNALNEPSRRAALRLGFQFEGVFRQHMIVKARNRDTAWFSMLDYQWPARKAAFENWLDPANFRPDGTQKVALSAMNARVTE